MPKSSSIREPKPIILIISHGDRSPNRGLHNKLAKKMNGNVAFFAHYLHTEENGEPFYSLELLDNSRNNIDKQTSAVQIAITRNMSGCFTRNKSSYNLAQLLSIVFSAARKVDFSITGKSIFSCYRPVFIPKMFLFLDANLTRPGTGLITEQFHNTLHVVSRTFRRIYSAIAELHVYPFSQEDAACEKANTYLVGDLEVDGHKLEEDILIQHGYAIDRLFLDRHVKYPELNTEDDEESLLHDETNCCFPFFNSGTKPATVAPSASSNYLNEQDEKTNVEDDMILRSLKVDTSFRDVEHISSQPASNTERGF